MKDRAFKYFTQLYNMEYNTRPLLDLNIISPTTVSREVNAWLRHYPTEKEVHDTLFSFVVNKTLDLDGVPTEFYKNTEI